MGVIVRQRKDKSGWWAFVHHQGKRTKRHFHTEKEARHFSELLSAQLKLSEFNGEASPLADRNRQMPTVKTYLTDWLHVYAEVHCKKTTAHGYRTMCNQHLVPVFGDRKLDEVTRADIKRLIADLSGKGLKKQTIHNILTPLKEAYHHAMDEGFVSSNPVARTGRLTHSREDRRLHMSPLDAEEVKTLLQHTREKVPSLYAILLCAVRTGLRQGELIGLQWSDIDFRSGFLEVRRAVVKRQLNSEDI